MAVVDVGGAEEAAASDVEVVDVADAGVVAMAVVVVAEVAEVAEPTAMELRGEEAVAERSAAAVVSQGARLAD